MKDFLLMVLLIVYWWALASVIAWAFDWPLGHVLLSVIVGVVASDKVRGYSSSRRGVE
jgi:hypothetical protein